jgi:UDPglucose 6-dehydrogenase
MTAKNKIGIVGYGIVGKATHLGLLSEQSVVIHDIRLDTKLEDLYVCEYVFFCIPTDSDASIQLLLEEIRLLKSYNPNVKIVIRSTVPVGTCAMIELAINDSIYYIPEFLRERMWEEDCFNRPIVVGSKNASLPDWLRTEEFISVTLEEAEVIKMMSNNMATARVTLANHFYELSRAVGADYDSVLQTYLQVNHDQNYLEVNDNLRAFGGKCLPKDLDFLINTFSRLNLPQTYFTAIRDDNNLWPITVRKS